MRKYYKIFCTIYLKILDKFIRQMNQYAVIVGKELVVAPIK